MGADDKTTISELSLLKVRMNFPHSCSVQASGFSQTAFRCRSKRLQNNVFCPGNGDDAAAVASATGAAPGRLGGCGQFTEMWPLTQQLWHDLRSTQAVPAPLPGCHPPDCHPPESPFFHLPLPLPFPLPFLPLPFWNASREGPCCSGASACLSSSSSGQ